MEKVEILFEKIKDLKDEKVNEILKDIVIIDGAIVQEGNTEYKKNTNMIMEEKYKDELDNINYSIVKNIVDVKLNKYVESKEKDINTILGNLKVALIRIAGIRVFNNEKISDLLHKIKNEIDPKMVYKIYSEIDDEIINNIQ